MANTYNAIATTTVGSGGSSAITFSSIPTTYTDLLIKISSRMNKGSVSNSAGIYFNGSSTGYTTRSIVGNGATATSGLDAGFADGYYGESVADGATASTFSNQEIYIPNYQSSYKKSFYSDSIAENDGTTAYQQFIAGFWDNTAAITSIGLRSFNNGAYNFNQYTTVTLYGISST